MAAKAKIWTISALVAAAMDEEDGKRAVQIGRGETKSYVQCKTHFTNDSLIVMFLHDVGGTDKPREIGPREAEELLRSQKSLTPKPSKRKRVKEIAKREKRERKEAKAAKREAKKNGVYVRGKSETETPPKVDA